jgi:P22 coat protein - gene protein 5
MGNTLITPIWTLKEVGRSLYNNLKFAANVSRSYDDQYRQGGAKVGWFVNARLPQRFRTTRGQALQLQAINDNVVPIALTDQLNVAFGWSSAQGTLEIEDVRRRYTIPAGAQIANTVDADGLYRCYGDVFWMVKADDLDNQAYLDASALLTDAGVPTPRIMVTSAKMMSHIVGKGLALFNPAAVISEGFKQGIYGRNVLGWEEWYQDQNVVTHTVGPQGGSPQVDGALQTGSTLLLKGFTAAAALRLKRGDEFTVTGVEGINPQNYNTLGSLQTFTALADVYSDAAGKASVPIAPAIVTIGSQQTVTASPADNAPVTLIGVAGERWQQALGFFEDAFALVTADLEMPKSGSAERIRARDLGLALRYWEDSMITDDSHPSRIDILVGWKTVRPEMAMRLWGKVLP